MNFITDFDNDILNDMISLIEGYERIVLFGYGPSLLCAQYIEYRLRTTTYKVVIAVVDEVSITSLSDKNTLLIIFTVTGMYRDFKKIYHNAREKRAKVVIISQHYNTSLIDQCDTVFFLTNEPASQDIIPYEQSRTLFFIFMEEVIQGIST